ncbi:MAG: hypothetical protein ACTSU8_05775 [Alphaproteobacteria bacterium]
MAATTFLVAATKALGFQWFPIASKDDATKGQPFLDVTEEIPKSGDTCLDCKGSGEEYSKDGKTAYQCAQCSGYGVSDNGNGYTVQRSVTWLFWADKGVEIEGVEHSPGEFWKKLLDDKFPLTNPHSVITTLAKAYNVGGEMKPSERLRLIEEQVLRPLGEEPRREILERAIYLYRGLCWKLQAKETHPIFEEPLYRHIIVRQGRDNAYLRFDWSPERKLRKLKEYGMA